MAHGKKRYSASVCEFNLISNWVWRIASVGVSRERRAQRAAREGSSVPVADAPRTMRCHCSCDGKKQKGMTDLLRQMIRAGEAGGWGSAGATGLDLELELALVLVLVFVVVVTTSFLEARPAPSSPGPRGVTLAPLELPLPPSGASFLCLFFFLVILRSG